MLTQWCIMCDRRAGVRVLALTLQHAGVRGARWPIPCNMACAWFLPCNMLVCVVQVWARQLANGDIAVALLNKARKMPAAAPRTPYYPFPRGKFHTKGNIWGFAEG